MAFLGEMAARIAHNVKNPLSGMKTIVQLMEEDPLLPENARRDCRMLVVEIDRLNRNISQVCVMQSPARDTDRPADLAAVVKRVANISRVEAEQRHIALEVDDAWPCLIEGGEEAASDIVSNLLVNALEASGEGSAIQIRMARPRQSRSILNSRLRIREAEFPRINWVKYSNPFLPPGQGDGFGSGHREAPGG